VQQDSETTTAGPATPERPPDLSTLKIARATPTVNWTCPECGKTPSVASNALLALVVAGNGAALKCPLADCGKWVRVEGEPPNKPPRQLVAVANNREAKRAIDALKRKGLVHAR
jgi:hypothetical protein